MNKQAAFLGSILVFLTLIFLVFLNGIDPSKAESIGNLIFFIVRLTIVMMSS